MALIKCWECGKDISDTAKKCPNCGAKIANKGKKKKKWLIIGSIVIILVGILLILILTKENNANGKDFIGTWEYVNSTYEPYEEIEKERLNLNITADHLNVDFAFGNGVFFTYDKQMLKTMDADFNYACFTLNDNELKQDKCSTEIVKFVSKMHSDLGKEIGMYSIIYKKVD